MLTKSILTIFCFLIFYLTNEALHKKFRIKTYYTRKIAHTVSGLGAAVASLVLSRAEFLLVSLTFCSVFIFSHKRKLLKSIHVQDSIGEVLYPIALVILAIFLYDQKALLIQGILILALSDTISAFFGKKYAQEYDSRRSFMSHLITSFIILIFSLNVPTAIVLAVLLAFVESVSFNGWDNLSVPVTFLVLVKLFQL